DAAGRPADRRGHPLGRRRPGRAPGRARHPHLLGQLRGEGGRRPGGPLGGPRARRRPPAPPRDPPPGPVTDPGDLTGRTRDWWDADAATYDDSTDHGWAAASPALRAAWNAALHRLRPAGGSRGLDGGAGTGVPSGAAARV